MTAAVLSAELVALLLSLLSCAAAVAGRNRASLRLFAAAWLAALLLLVLNALMAGAPPFGNMRHVLCFFPLMMGPAALYMARCRDWPLWGCFSAASALALLGALCMPMQAAWRQMPALQSPYFVPHVSAYVLAYGLLGVAAALALLSLRPTRQRLLEAADELVLLAFPLLSFGLWSGALWADAAWGRYWAWDIKEAWSLLSWLLYLLYFHLRRYPAFAAWRRPLILLGFAAVLLTFFVVNLLPQLQSLHSYAQ